MGYDRIDTMYDALSKDGAEIGTRQQFKELMLAPGKQGYQNRLDFFNAMKQDGAEIGDTYEDFARAIGLHAVVSQKKATQPQRPVTTSERARQVNQAFLRGNGQNKQQPKPQQPNTATGPDTDYMENWNLLHKRDEQLTPFDRAKVNKMRSNMQRAQDEAYRKEQSRPHLQNRSASMPQRSFGQDKALPGSKSSASLLHDLSSPEAKRARAMQQRKDDAKGAAGYEITGNTFTHNDGKYGPLSTDIDSLVEPSMKEADDLSWTQYQKALREAKGDAYLRNKAWQDLQDNRIKNRQEVLANNLSAKLQDLYSNRGLQMHIIESADKLNMSVEEYVDKYVTPQMMQRAQDVLGVKNAEELLPKSATEYVVRKLSDTILGTLSAAQDKSKGQMIREQQAMAIADGLEEMPTVKGYKAQEGYKSGVGARFISTAANMAMDSPILYTTGGASGLSVDLGKRVLMTGLSKVGLVKAGTKLTAKQLAFKAANMTMAQKIGSGLLEGTAKGALNLGSYSGITAALGQASTGDDTSLAAVGHAAVEGFEHGSTTGAMFGLSGAVMAPWVSKFGITGTETSASQKWLHGAQKFGATATGLGAEAATMMVADNITGDKDISVGTWLEDVVMVGAFKAGEPKNYGHIGRALYGLTHNTNNAFLFGRDEKGNWRKVDVHMTKDEQNELMASTSGKNLMDAFSRVDKSSLNSKTPLDKNITKQAYEDFMNDPNVSQSTKEKVNAAMGLFNTSRDRSYRSVNDVKNRQILEYSKNGTLLTRTSYKNADERRAILYKQKANRDNDEMMSLIGYSKMRDLQVTDEDGLVTKLAYDFLLENGYNADEKATEPNNAILVAGLKDKDSVLYKKWEKYVEKNGTLGKIISETLRFDSSDKAALKEMLGFGESKIDLYSIMRKDPMKRTDEENKIFNEAKSLLESKLFPNGKPHADQSAKQGETVASDNNLGTEQPNGEAVRQELDGLRQAEAEMGELMRDNDVFNQNYNRLREQGLTNPQIYDWMIQQGGLTEEQLEPLAHYINANARVQGMQEATSRNIEEVVSSVVQDWSYKGTLNGQKMDGEHVVYVQDSEGRTLIVGSGDVTFGSSTGRVNDGDMLICLDPNTKEMVYVKADEVTFFQTQKPEDFANEYRQRLQMINSRPYNEAAQEQAAQDVVKAENQNHNPSVQGINSVNGIPFEQIKPIGTGDFGNIYDQFRGKPDEAVAFLTQQQGGEALGALHHDAVGDIDLVWGKTGTKHSDGFGLSKLVKYHPEVVANLQEILSSMKVDKVSPNRVNLSSDKYKAAIRLDYDGKSKTWLLAAYEKEVPSDSGKTTDTATSSLSGDTALTQSEGIPSVGKDTKKSSNGNGLETTLTFKDGSPVPMVKDSKGRATPNFAKMAPEQAAEVLTKQMGDNAEKYADAQIKAAEQTLKDAEKMKVDYSDFNDALEQEAKKKAAIEAAKKQLEQAQNIKKAITAQKVAETVAKPTEGEKVDGVHEAGSVPAQKFQSAKRLVGNKRTRMLADGETKVRGHYEIVPAESLTPSHDVYNGYKKSDGFPVDAEGRTVNDRDYEHDKAAQQTTDQMALKYNGQAIEQVPVVSDEGIVYDGNGRTMAGQKAAKNGTDKEYINDLLENAENFGFTREQIEQSGIEHPRLVLVTDERLPYDTATFAKFNRNEKKTQSNTEQAVAKAKTLTPDEVGAIVADIDGNGSLDAFFNNSKAINDLVRTLVDKGIIGQNEVAQMMDSPERLSAQGKEYVKNLLLGSIFKPETIRMLGIDPGVKNKAVAALRAVMDNMKLGDYSLRDEIDQAIQLLYEARWGDNKVDTLLRTPEMFGENAADRYSPVSQMMALALEGKVSDFRDLLDEYNRIAAARNTGEGDMFGPKLTHDELINEYLKFKKWQDYGTRHSETKRNNDVPGVEEPQQETSGGNEPAKAEAKPERRVEEDDVHLHPEKEDGMRLLPPEEKPDPKYNPIEAAAADYKKDHPLTEEEIMNTTAFDDLPEDQKQYCIDAALDYLNGEDKSAIAEAYYRNAYEKRTNRPVETDEPSKPAKPDASADPMEGLKKAAEGYEKEKSAPKGEAKKPAKKQTRKALEAERDAADNEFEAFMKELRKKRSGQLNSGFIDQNLIEAAPKMFSLAAKCAYSRIKLGMYDAKEVVKDLRNRFKEAFEGFDKRDVETFYAEIMSQKWRDGDKRMSLNDWAEHYRKLSPEYKENLEGDSKEAEERKQNETIFIGKIRKRIIFSKPIKSITELRKLAEDSGLKGVKDTDLQELAESAVVSLSREVCDSGAMSDDVKFKKVLNIYNNQPSLNQRDSERVMKQQYSTPAPYAFLADMYVMGNGKEVKSALEPSAGNGMLTIGLPMDVVHVNDIDAQRLANLRRQGFKNVTSQDGTQPFADKDVDVVVTNPPFGSATPKEYDGYKISSLEGQMAINALESMKDDGRAAIIIGGKTEYAKNGSLNPKDKAFLGYLYSHYNVEDVINVDGSLYAKQGTTYPTRIILINGRRLDENAFPPVKSKARAEAVKDYDELYKRIKDDILRGERMDSSIGREKGGARPGLDKRSSDDTHEKGLRMGRPRGGERKAPDGLGGVSTETPVRVPNNELGNGRGAERRPDVGLQESVTGTNPARTESYQSQRRGDNSDRHGVGGSVRQSKGIGRENAEHSTDGSTSVLKPKPAQERSLSSEKVNYSPKSGNPFTLDSVMPADQQEAVNKNLEKLGDADQFLVDELGYNDKDDLYSHLAAEQIDSVALALKQAKKGNAFIIGDMTGIGKGRQAASLIRYAKKQGQVPVYFTKTAGLLSDVYRDLVDIGSPDLRPFVFGSSDEAKITDSEGKVVFKLPTDKEKERVLDYISKNGKLPEEYDYVLTTYSQVANGVYEFDENDNRKERKLKKGDKFGPSHFSGQARRDAIEKIISNGYLILDESHTAGGQSNQGNYFQHIIQKAKNVTFFSATFAKRPDNMPIYALRTAMNQGGLKASELIDAVKRGGATLQEIMSQTLTQCGQMIRRERDMTGVTIDWKPIDDPAVVAEQREQYDKTIELFNDIINFQKAYVIPYIEERNEELAAIQASMGLKRGTKALGIASTPFASKAFNTVQQVLLSLKAKEAAKRAIDYLNQGMKPVIALNNTNESQSGEIKENDEVEEPDLGTSLKKGLAGTLRYTKKNAKNKEESGVIDVSSLGEDAVNAYNELMKKIENASTGLALSPIDVIKNELQKAGYKVGELTGRKSEFIYNDNGTVSKVKRTNTNKKKLAREFNDGGIDALILNKSASTGISLHASSKFKDQRKRVMIVAQQQLDVNDEVQMRGRIDRTGQVTRGAYEYIVSQIPAEQRLLMMFKAKLKSLDANTTSSQKSNFNHMDVADITNKYGDKICKEYMAEHLDLYSRMADPFGWEKNGVDLYSVDHQKLINSKGGKDYEDGQAASKLLGRMALLKVEEQEKMLKEIGELYAAEIQRLDEMGENDLEITELPLKAKTISKEVWKEGAEPGGDNAFADNTYIEKVNMAILKKPMKAEEVKKAQDGLTDGKSWEEYRESKKAEVRAFFEQKLVEETQKYEERAVKIATKAKEKYLKDAKKGQKDSGMSDERIEQMAGFQYDNIYKQEKEKLNDVVKNIKAKAEMFYRVLDTFNTKEAYVLPVDMSNPNELSGFGNSYGRLIDIKITDNFSTNASSVSFATLDGRRKITFPVSGMIGSGENRTDVIGSIYRMTKQASSLGDKQLRVLSMDADNWDRLVSNESRKDGYIITGNLMQALIDTKNQGAGGQLVKYTTDTGEVKTGILMPDRFKPTDVANEYPISSKADALEKPSFKGGIDEVASSDGEVKIKHIENWRGESYEIRVSKSKAKGGKFFLDNDLMSMMDGNNFESRGNSMLGVFKKEQLRSVLDRLSNLGVKVREERKAADDSGTHFREDRGLQYSKTDKKDVKNNRIIPEDVDKNVSLQIEKKFDDEVKGVYGRELTPDENKEVVRIANVYRNTPLNDEVSTDKNGNRKYHGGLESAIKTWNDLSKDFEDYYGITRGTKLTTSESRQSGRLGGVSSVLPESQGERGIDGRNRAGDGNIPKEAIRDYQNLIVNLAAANRALEYHKERARVLSEQYGVKHDEWLQPETIERIFNDFNSDKNLQEIYNRIKDQVGNLDVHFGETYGGERYMDGFYRHSLNDIRINFDRLVSFGRTRQEIASTILHEMLHPVTSDIIAMYQKGHTDKLTEEQIEAAKEAVDIYNELKQMQADGKIGKHYGLTNPREMITELATPEWRKVLSEIPNGKHWWNRIINTIAKFFGINKFNKLGELTNTLDKLLNNFGKDQFDFATKHYRDLFGRQGKDGGTSVSSHIAELSEKVGAKVNMVNSAEEVTNKEARAAIEAGKEVTGWYDEKTGEVYLYMPNIHDRYTAEKTIWHEVVGHKGLRALFGEDRFDKFLRDIWYNLDKPEYAALKKLVDEEMRYNPLNIYNAIEEGIARLAEEGRGEAGFWNNIKNKVSDFFHEIGYRLAPNTKDVKYLLWLSKNLQKNPNDPYWKMRAEAVKYRLDHEDMPSVIEHEGMFYDNAGKVYKDLGDLPKKEWDEATDGQIHFRTTPSAGTALDRYHRSLDAHGYMFTESYMDNMLSLKKLMTAIVPGKKIEDIASSENPYILQNTMQGAMSNASQMFERNVMKPLDKAMADVLDAFDGKNDEEKIRSFNLYMIAKHGLERNRVFFVRDYVNKLRQDENTAQDAKDLQNKWNAEKKDLGEKLRNGSIDLKEYYGRMDEWIRNNVDSDFDTGEHDYSGFHGMYGIDDKKAPYNDADVIAEVMDAESKMEDIKKGSVKDFWDKVKTATQYALDCDYNNGIATRENHDNVSAMFDWYVPLRKFDEATAEDVYGYITEKGDPHSFIGATLMRARGRKSLSETNILAQIGAMGNAAINRGGQNVIKQAFTRFIRNNGGQGLVTEANVWVEKKGTDASGNPIWEESYPQIPDGATADEIAQIVDDFETDMKAKEANGDAKNISRRGNVGFRFGRAKNKSQHIVDVMIAGKKHSFIVNGNPRAAQALNGLLEHKNDTPVGKIFGKISRFMAQTCTSYSPEFVMRNMIRDFEFASSNLLAKEGARYTSVFEKYYAQVGIIEGIRNSKLSDFKDTGGFGLFAKYRNGTLDINDKIQRYFKEFMENGGETGWVQIKNIKEWTEEYKRNVRTERNKVAKVGKGFYNAIFKNLENINEIAENMARFATYCASRDYGRSVVRSAYDAKEVSTNFNRHGSGSEIRSFKNGEMGTFRNARKQFYRFSSAWLRNTSMFFNAGIQSTNLLVKNLKNNAVGTVGYIVSGPLISGMGIALLNNFLIANEDEKDRKGVKDPYGELPDYIRRNNLCVYVGNGEFVTIPLAIEERAFYGLGDLVAGLTFSPNVSGLKNPYLDAVGCISQLVPVADYLGNASFGKHPGQETVKAVLPSALSPFIEWAYNSDWKGAPIERDNKFDENQPAWMLAYKGTPDFLININKKVNAWSNDVASGNENMKGNDFLDAVTNPSGIQHFYSSYLGGAATFAERVTGLVKHGSDTETKDIPFVRSLFYTPSEKTNLQRTKSKWYNYMDEMEKTIANVNRLKSKNVPLDKRLQNIGDYYNFQNSKEAAKVRMIELARKEMKRWKDLRDKGGDTDSVKFANDNIDMIMQDAVKKLDKLN